MSSFKNQIESDIADYQATKGNIIPSIKTNDWAFNYWVLDKFFYEDEDLIIDKIIDYHDKGIDCYEWYEDTKELYLIQNKYYDEKTQLSLTYVTNTFLIDPIAVLESGQYTHCKELQKIYNDNRKEEQFTIHLQLYITNNAVDEKIRKAINDYNKVNAPQVTAEVFYLSDIEQKWYGEAKKAKKSLSVEILSVNNSTILNISNKDYGLENELDAKYVLVPVSCIYRMMEEAQNKGYALFEDNIREYLGNKGINRNIYNTLKNEKERKNFFYYNNGITMICESFTGAKTTTSKVPHIGVSFSVKNPKIVNGCQTVSSIYSALKTYDSSDIDQHFKDTFVMLKILCVAPDKEAEKEISKNIVRYNNSQNSIDEKNFSANIALFQRYKEEFLQRGYLLLIKQSDKNAGSEKYKKKSDLIKLQGKGAARRAIFGLDDKSKLSDLFIPLEKLLQVVIAFKVGGLAAYTLKKDVLKPDTETYTAAVDFIKSSNVTSDVLLSLYLLYARFESEKNKEKEVTVIPFYAIDGFARFECGNDSGKIAENLNENAKIETLVHIYKRAIDSYAEQFKTINNVEYIKMIKMDIDYNQLALAHKSVKKFFK